MEAAASGAADVLSPPEADWPPDLRLPARPARPPPPAQASHMDDSQFLGSIMGDSVRQGPAEPPAQHLAAPVIGPKKRGRPPKRRDGSAAVVAAAAPAKPAAKRGQDEEEVVCFICFDGGNLVLCDRRGCPKVYHPACIKRDESFFNSRTKWNCGWHICSSCEKAVHYMCYTCTYSLCKVCIKQGKFFSVRGAKGFCDTCYGTILLIESKDEASIKVDFDDINSWEYLFKLYWLDLKGKLSLTLEELTSAKTRWTVPNTSTRKEKEESSDDLYNIDNDDDVGSDCSSRKRRRNSSKKKGQKRQKVNSSCSVPAIKVEPAITDAGSLATKVPTEGVSSRVDTKWASPELLEFVGHMRGGDQSLISQFDVQTDLLEYIKKNNLRDPKRKSQIICDARLHRLFRKARVAHFEMLQLLEMHFLVNETSKVNGNSQAAIYLNTAQIDTNGHSDMSVNLTPDKRRRIHRKMEREPQVNPEAYAAVDMHNVNLIYMRRSLMEDLIDDAAFSEKIRDAFVRIKISGVGQKQDMYRLVKVVGTHKVPEKYSIGKKTTNYALEILNLDKKEIITMDTVSNQDFTEEECNRLRQSMKCGLISRLKVGAVQEKAKVLQSVRVNDCLENEKQRLEHLRDRASETGRKKELRECVEKLQLLNNSEERTRRINEVLEVHVDAHMDPSYESAEEMGDKKSVGENVNMTRTHTSVSRRKSKYPKSTLNHTQKISDASYYPKTLPTESTTRGLRTVKKFENFHLTNGTDIPRSSITCEAGSVSSSVLTMSSETEPEKVWHYKDPSGTVQGPFTLLQLSKWTSYFPRDLRVWLTFESEERSLLLTEVLSKQQTVFTQTASVTKSTKATSAGIDHNKNSLSMDQMNALSPTGYSMLNSSVVTVQSNKNSVLERESVNSPEDCLSLSTSSIPPKYVHTLNSQGRCQVKNSVFVQSPGSPCGQTDLHHDGARGGCSGESNHHHGSFALKSSIMAQMSCNGKSPLFAWSPSESRTASSQHDGSCLSSTTNLNFLDEHHSSVATAKPKCCAPATPIEDRGSSSPSGMLSHSERVPICSPKSAPSASVSDMCKDEIMNQQRTLDADTSNASVNQSPESKIFPVYSPDNQDVDHKFPSPTPRSENKEPVVDNSGLKPASPENLANICSPLSGSCKMEKIVNQHNILEADASHSSANHYPQSEVLHVTSSNDKDIEPKSMRSDNKEPAIDNSLLTVAATENLRMASASDTDTCKMEATMNQQTTLEEGVSNASINQSPHSNVEHAYPMLAPSSGNKEPTENPSMAAASDAGTCKMEATTKQQTTLEEDVSNASINRSPHSKNFLVSFIDNQDIECAYPSPTPRSGDKEPSVDNSGLKSGTHENLFTAANASDACKMEEILDKKVTIETNASSGSTTPPSKVSPVSSPDNRDIEHESPGPAPKSENREPFVDNSVLLSSVPENETSTSASASDGCKMEMPDKKSTLETDTSNGSVAPCPRSEHFLVTSDNQDIQHEYPSSTPRPENIPVVDTGMLILEAPDNLTTKTHCDSADAFALPKLGPSNGKLDAVESDFKSVEEIIQNELYCESTVVTKENIVIDPSCGAESIDVSDVLESLLEQRSGTSYMHGTVALEDLLAASTEEEPQCSSPIALSPWGEPSYYQGDVDSALWGIEDDPANDMWSLLSTTPTLQPSSEGLGTKASETLDISEVAVSDGISEFFQSGPMLGTENVKNAISDAATDWQLPEQVKSKPNDISASSVDGNRGIAGWQPSASENVSAGTASGTSHNLYLPGCEKASRKQESTDLSVSWSRDAIGNTNKSWNPPSVNANRGNQKNHRRGRYSEISESWLLSSTNSRSRSDRFGNGGSSRPTLNGQSRGVCKFNEGGYCRKGASCSYLHP